MIEFVLVYGSRDDAVAAFPNAEHIHYLHDAAVKAWRNGEEDWAGRTVILYHAQREHLRAFTESAETGGHTVKRSGW